MDNPIVVALDGMNREKALELARELSGLVWGFKVNSLLLECGASVIPELLQFGEVMADPKLHDIPNTVRNSVKTLAEAGSAFVTVHASGGVEMLRAAAAESGGVIAVTVLTSLTRDDTGPIYGKTPEAAVHAFARMARDADCRGIVCSPRELDMLSVREFEGLAKIVPGIRHPASPPDDQRRTMAPGDAIRRGANHLVIGRPITAQGDPRQNAELILGEIAAARST